jgi:hypothetical protein
MVTLLESGVVDGAEKWQGHWVVPEETTKENVHVRPRGRPRKALR